MALDTHERIAAWLAHLQAADQEIEDVQDDGAFEASEADEEDMDEQAIIDAAFEEQAIEDQLDDDQTVNDTLADVAMQTRRFRTMESAANRLQKEAKGYLDSLRGTSQSKLGYEDTDSSKR